MKPDTYRDHLTDLQVEIEELKAQLAVQPKPPENGSISAKTADNRNDRTTGDTISRQAAIDALEREKTYCTAFREGYTPINAFEKYNNGLTDGIKALKNLPSAQPEQRWIPCREKLPEASGRYLVTRGLNACGSLWNRVYITNYSDLMGLKSEKIWWHGSVGKSDFERLDDVLAWMPLPEPYKGEER